MKHGDDNNSEGRPHSAALQNAQSILLAQQRIHQDLLDARDALERRTIELAHTLSLVRATLESTTDGILVTDADGRATDSNAKLAQMWGIPHGPSDPQAQARFDEQLAARVKNPDAYRARLREIHEQRPPETSDQLELADGRIFERYSKVRRLNDQIIGRVWSFRDVTERRRANEVRAHLAAVVESSEDAIISKTLEGIIKTWNRGAERMFGYAAHEVIGKPVLILIPPDCANEEPAILERLKRGERIDHYETVRRRKDGSLLDISLTVSPIRDAAGTIIGASKIGRDITEKKRAERLSREQSEWFKVTLGSIGDGVITVDTERRVTFMNPVAEKLTGWNTSEAVGCLIDEVFVIENEMTGEPVVNPIVRALAEGVVVALANHTCLTRRDHTKIPIEDSAAPIRHPTGETVGAVIVFHDVSARRREQLALAKSEQRFRRLGEVVPQLIWMTDAQGRPEFFNERWHQYTGVAPDGPHAMEWLDSVHPADRDRTMEQWMHAVRSGEPYETEYRLRRRDGEYRWFVARGVPLRDDDGKIVRWYGSSTDIHQQKLTVQALHEQYTVTEQLNEVAQTLATELDFDKIAQIVTDAAMRATRAQFGVFRSHHGGERGDSAEAHTVSGMSRAAFENHPLLGANALSSPTFRGEGVIRLDDVRTDPRFANDASYRNVSATHPPVASYLAVPVIARSGEVLGGLFFGHAEPGVFTARDEKVVLGIAAQAAAAMDNARLYRLEQQARSEAEKANRAKDDFLAALSHELRTPLTPVLAILSGLGEETGIPEAVASELEIVRRNVELEARLIDDLLDLTRVTRGKLELHHERIAVSQLIENAIHTCRAELDAKKLRLVKAIETPGQIIEADSARVTQILWNLLKNSVKFTPGGGTITIRSTKVANPDRVVIAVTDTGIGIESDRLPRVFDAFEQGGRKITQQFGGLGLGLAISKAIAEAHGGAITATSAGTNQGSTFTLELPLASRVETTTGDHRPEAAIAPRAPAVAPAPTTPPRGAPRLLLVEDHADTATTLARLLRRSGYDVVVASSSRTALAAAEQETREGGLDLVISDLGLPDGSGCVLMRELSTRYGLRGVALSGYGMDSDRDESAAAGFARHLIKPVDIAVLRRTLAELLPNK